MFYLFTIIVICISRARNHSSTYREKNCRRGRLRPKQDNLKDVRVLHGKSDLCQMTFTLTAVVKSNGGEIGFRGLFLGTPSNRFAYGCTTKLLFAIMLQN
jgi:hypothetical protein